MAELSLTALEHLFEQHRIVFWYDEGGALAESYKGWSYPGVRKLELDRNAFKIKYTVLVEAPNDKFLIYSQEAKPCNREDWLADLYLAHGIFKTDESSLVLTSLGLPESRFAPFVAEYDAFFKEQKLFKKIKAAISPEQETRESLAIKMLCLVVGVHPESSFNELLMVLLNEVSGDVSHPSPLWDKVCAVRLEGLFWKLIHRNFGYHKEGTSLFEFVLHLFEYMWKQDSELFTTSAISFFNLWRNHQQYMDAYKRLADEIARALAVDVEVSSAAYESFGQLDCFKNFDLRIVIQLESDIRNFAVSREIVKQVIQQQRKGSYWRKTFEDAYAALDAASEFLMTLPRVQFDVASVNDAVTKYADKWWRIDYLYRTFTYHAKRVGQSDLPVDFAQLKVLVDNQYESCAQFNMNLCFQKAIDQEEAWDARAGILQQSKFYTTKVAPRQHKLCVIISDALRYEVAMSLTDRLTTLNNFEAHIEPMVANLPSYTQLGMAALLPHQALELSMKHPGNVLVDGRPSVGVEDRRAILAAELPGRATAVRADDVDKMTQAELTELQKHELVYVYHNTIDATGDSAKTEKNTFDVAYEAINELEALIRRMGRNRGFEHFIVTADHGFMYQDKLVNDVDFRDAPEQGKILFKNRRFVLGTNLQAEEGWRHYTSEQLGLAGEMEVLIPTFVGKCRIQGAGSRFTHGGATLQEVVVPIVEVNRKKDGEKAHPVELAIVQDTNTLITTGALSVSIEQKEVVGGKVSARTARVVLKSVDGSEIYSEPYEYTFDSTETDPNQRVMKTVLSLNQAGNTLTRAEVKLYLEEPIPRTSEYKVIATRQYRILRSFGNDFDF